MVFYSKIQGTIAEHGAGADVDSAWEQAKPEATLSEMLEKAADSHTSRACFVVRFSSTRTF